MAADAGGQRFPNPILLGLSRTAPVLRLSMVLSLALSTQGLLVTQGIFLLRQTYVAEHLCENRHDPRSHCHGRCFVRKQAERHRDQQERQPLALAQVLLTPALTAPAVEAPPPDPAEPAVYAAFAGGPSTPGFPDEVFVPPRAS
jgi:hypothetical protein